MAWTRATVLCPRIAMPSHSWQRHLLTCKPRRANTFMRGNGIPRVPSAVRPLSHLLFIFFLSSRSTGLESMSILLYVAGEEELPVTGGISVAISPSAYSVPHSLPMTSSSGPVPNCERAKTIWRMSSGASLGECSTTHSGTETRGLDSSDLLHNTGS
jgi:hypothetical protein